MVKKNLSGLEALIRTLLGFAFVTYFFLGGPWWSLFAIYLLFTGCLGFCIVKRIISG